MWHGLIGTAPLEGGRGEVVSFQEKVPFSHLESVAAGAVDSNWIRCIFKVPRGIMAQQQKERLN